MRGRRLDGTQDPRPNGQDDFPASLSGSDDPRGSLNRLLVLGVLKQSIRPMSAYDIRAALRSRKNMSPISVYRALHRLEEMGQVHRLEALNAFVPCTHKHAGGGAHVFYTCEECGQTKEFPAEELMSGVRMHLKTQAFRVTHAAFELRGQCEACAQLANPRGH
jgi:Fur family zinc uptake transcriptional regulator